MKINSLTFAGRCALAAFFITLPFAPTCAEEPAAYFSPVIEAGNKSQDHSPAEVVAPVEVLPLPVSTNILHNNDLPASVVDVIPPIEIKPVPKVTPVLDPADSLKPIEIPAVDRVITPLNSAATLASKEVLAPVPISGLRSVAELPDQFDLAEAILSLGNEQGFQLSEPVAKTLQRLDEWAARAKEQLPANPDVTDYFDALYDTVLLRRPAEASREERAEDFDLSRAVFQRHGSCLSLGIMALAVARRMGAQVHGAQCPGHFFLRGEGVVKGKSKITALNFDVTRPTPENWSKLDDNFYRKWRHFDSKAEENGEYLRPMSDKQVVSAYLSSRAGFLARAKNFDGAFADAERALALNPRNINALINAGYALESKRELGEAESYYRRALEVDPQSVRAMNNLAFVKIRDKKSASFDLKQAERLIDKAIKLDTDQAYLYATRGEIMAAKGDYSEATRSMQTAAGMDKKNAAYHDRFMALREHLRREIKPEK